MNVKVSGDVSKDFEDSGSKMLKKNKMTKKKNLYATSFGDYDFQKDLRSDLELNFDGPVGKEGWGFEDEQ